MSDVCRSYCALKEHNFVLEIKLFKTTKKHTHQISNTRSRTQTQTRAHSLTQLSCKVTWWKGQKAVSPFTFHARLKLVAAAAAGYCIGLLVTFHSVLVTFQQHPHHPHWHVLITGDLRKYSAGACLPKWALQYHSCSQKSWRQSSFLFKNLSTALFLKVMISLVTWVDEVDDQTSPSAKKEREKKRKIRGKDLGLSSSPTHFTLFQLNLK